jgi:hypothetical protein
VGAAVRPTRVPGKTPRGRDTWRTRKSPVNVPASHDAHGVTQFNIPDAVGDPARRRIGELGRMLDLENDRVDVGYLARRRGCAPRPRRVYRGRNAESLEGTGAP